MSKKVCIGMLALALVWWGALVVLPGCGGGGGNDGTGDDVGVITPDQLAAIEHDSAQVDQLITEYGVDDFARVATAARDLPAVEWARADGDCLTVKYEHGGQQAWLVAPRPQAPSSWVSGGTRAAASSVHLEETVGSTEAVVINALSEDATAGPLVNALMDEAADLLGESRFSVRRIDGANVNVAAMKTLANAGAVVFLGHGNVLTYDEAGSDKGSFVQLGCTMPVWRAFVASFTADWIAQRVIPTGTVWEDGGLFDRGSIAVTDRFFRHYYKDAGVSLNHALFFNCACLSSRVPDMGDALTASGVAAYLGWTDSQRIAPWTAVQLLRAMKAGWSLEKSLGSMADEFKRDVYDDSQSVHHDASLTYSPSSGRTLQLQEQGTGVDPFRVTLNWDMDDDVDLHVFTSSGHSFYSNQSIAAGSLDYDDVDGYGPEHFTATVRIPGTYYVAVNYYSDYGAEETDYGTGRATRAWIQVETPTDVRNFGAHTLTEPNRNSGYPVTSGTRSWWRVCKITVSSGGGVTVAPDDTDVPLGFDGTTTYGAQARYAYPRVPKPYELDGIAGDATTRRYRDAAVGQQKVRK